MINGKNIETGTDIQKTSMTGWSTWGTLALFPLFAFAMQFSITLMVEPMKAEFQLNDIWIGVLSASYSVFYTLMQLPVGTLVDKFGTRKITLISLAGCIFFTILFAFSNGLTLALTARLGMGFFAASSFTCAFYSAGRWFEFKVFAVLVALTEGLANIGGVLGTSSLAYCVIHFGWRQSSLLMAIIGMVILILAIFYVKDKEDKKPASSVKSKKSGHSIYYIMGIVLRNKNIWLCGICIGLLFAPLSAFSGLWAVPFLMAKYNLDLVAAGRIVALSYLGAAIFSPVMALFANRFKKKAFIIKILSVVMLAVFIVIIYVPIKSELLNGLIFFLMGSVCCAYVIPFAIAKKIVRAKVSATALALANVLGGAIGSLLFQPLIGWILHIVNDYTQFQKSSEVTAYYVAFAIFPLSMIILYYLTGLIREPQDDDKIPKTVVDEKAPTPADEPEHDAQNASIIPS